MPSLPELVPLGVMPYSQHTLSGIYYFIFSIDKDISLSLKTTRNPVADRSILYFLHECEANV